MTKTKVAFIVVCWNNEPLLKECFESIENQTYKHHTTIMVDNSSKDASVAYTKNNHPDIEVIEEASNWGFAKGNNIGIKQAFKNKDIDYIVLLNTDARLAPDWLETVIKFAEKKPKGACFQGTTLDYYKHNIIDSTHIYISHNGQGTQGNWRKQYQYEIGPKKVFGVNAAVCLITRNFIEAQPFEDFFDETLFMYLEDVDVAVRATVMGWDNYLVHSARAYHMGSVSSSKNPGFSLYMTFRNNSAVLYKNLPVKMLFKMFPKIIRGDIDTIRTLYRTKRRTLIKYVIKGRLIGLLRLPLFVIKKSKIKKSTQIELSALWSLMRKGY